MGNLVCLDRDKQLIKSVNSSKTLGLEKKIDLEKREVNLVPKKRDFFTYYKFIHSKNKNEKHLLDMQYFTIRRAKAVNSKK